MLEDYSGAFNPEIRLEDFSRNFLVGLTHEFNLIGHLLDRCGQPLVAMEYGEAGFVRSGIEEWQCASPIYSRRMQELMNFKGDSVGTVFKNLQLDVGAPQQFMDFQFRLDSPDYGQFWLPFCGALLDLESIGNDESMIKAMCHDIEDPTFDATAAATHPRMVMRPFHRPPRTDNAGGCGAHRYPVCHWEVYISEEAQPYRNHDNLEKIAKTRLAGTACVDVSSGDDQGGWFDYAHDFDPHATFSDFSRRALVLIAQESAVQAMLLSHSYTLSQLTHYGSDVARRFSEGMWVGHAGVAALRLKRFLNLEDDGIEAIAKVLQLHPHFYPRSYVDFRVEVLSADRLRFSINDCPALHEDIPHNWFSQLADEPHRAFDALVQQVNPRARTQKSDKAGACYAWEVVLDAGIEPAAEPMEVQLGKISKGVDFRLMRRRQPDNLIARGRS